MKDISSTIQIYKNWQEKHLAEGFSALAEKITEHISKTDELVKAFCHLDPERIKQEAENIDKIKDPKLLGVPVAVKSNICMRGSLTSCGSKMLQDYRPPYDATVIEKLRRSGALIIGGTNMDEFAFGSSCESSFFGPTLNPWDVMRIPGGSSGGSAAAVASAEVPLAIGSDTGGSVRQPASMCGVVGLKPTYGRISRYGLIAFASSLDQIGIFSRDVRDCAALLEILSGSDEKDSTSVERKVPSYLREMPGVVDGLKIGVPKEYFDEGIDEAVLEKVQEAIDHYREQGAEIIDISLPHTKYAVGCYCLISCAEASSNLARYDGVHYGYRSDSAKDLKELYKLSRSESFGNEVKRRILLGTYSLSSGYYDAYYLKAQKVRTAISDDFNKAFRKCDLIITPTSPTTAFKLGEKLEDPLKMYLSDIFTVPANLAGLPAINVPCGFDSDDLPVGMQIMGPHFEESKLLNAAFAFQSRTKYHLKLPPILQKV